MYQGQEVVITSVDEDGLQGREPHPDPSDIGRVGTIVDIEQLLDPDTVIDLYTVRLHGSELRYQFAEWEIEVPTY